jgi:DNA-binding MarR family transcriptional regulator
VTERKPIGYWFKEIDRRLERSFEVLLAGEDLTRRHWQVLNTLAGGPRTAAELDEAVSPFLDVEHPTVAPVADELTRRGWATRGDRIALTDAGRSAHATVSERVRENRARLTDGISAEEYLAVVDVLERMATNLTEQLVSPE